MRAALAIGLAAVAIVVIVVVATGGGDDSSAASTSSTATTEIRRQDLVEVSSEDGTLGYADSRKVVNRLSGTVTWLPGTGTVVRPDGVLYRVDGSPVILMDGRVPAYRALSSGVSDGADVKQLERGLRSLGYDDGGAIDVDDSWDGGTTAAVKRWQEAHGFDQNGKIELGRIVFQPSARRVSEIDTTLGADGSSGSQDSDGGSASSGSANMQFASYTQPTTPQTTTPDATEEEEEAARRKAEKEKAAKEKAAKEKAAKEEAAKEEAAREKAAQESQAGQASPRSGEATASGGSGGSGGSGSSTSSPIMTTTSTRPVVTVDLDTDKQSLARAGAPVTVELPSGDVVDGRIEDVAKVATTPSSEGDSGSDPGAGDEAPTVEVTVRLAKRTGALDQAPVTVDFEQSRRRDVLAIPVTALLARAGGRFAVEVREGTGRRLVRVEPGLYTDGFVEISGEGLRPGMKVTDARV